MGRTASFWLAAGIALLISHDAVFLVQLGPGRALAAALSDAGHGHAYWANASSLLLTGGAIAAALWLVRLAVLRRAGGGPPQDVPGAETWRRRALTHWVRLFALVAIAFVLQENIEHALVHGHFIGLGALTGPEYPLAVPVLAMVAGLAAALTALVRQREVELLRRIGARARPPRAQRRHGHARPMRLGIRAGAPMCIHHALRAPPAGIAIQV
jgi:hypothetical protein